jgi:hypothetical protein
VKRDAIDPGLDKPFQKCGRIAVPAAAGIIGEIGNDERLVSGFAVAGAGDRLGDAQDMNRAVIAGRPSVVRTNSALKTDSICCVRPAK